jgi:hypothetical protein
MNGAPGPQCYTMEQNIYANGVACRGTSKMRGFFATLRMTRQKQEQRQKQIPSLTLRNDKKNDYSNSDQACVLCGLLWLAKSCRSFSAPDFLRGVLRPEIGCSSVRFFQLERNNHRAQGYWLPLPSTRPHCCGNSATAHREACGEDSPCGGSGFGAASGDARLAVQERRGIL